MGHLVVLIVTRGYAQEATDSQLLRGAATRKVTHLTQVRKAHFLCNVFTDLRCGR
jgi:hypothetical protein